MTSVDATVRADVPGSPYDIVVGRGIVDDLEQLVPALEEAENVFVLTQARLGDLAAKVSTGDGADTQILLLDEGESAKSLESVGRIYDALAARGAHRHDAIVAVGGGVVTDIGGFVASTFNRGMTLVNVPTTLLGQVDAAIGGKTGINLSYGKNLVGTIYQPAAVVCDIELLASLPESEFISGLAEVAKYGFISDPSLLDLLLENGAELRAGDPDLLAEIVARSARIKAAIVAEDERESGVRAHLNYGHTWAHAIERVSGYGHVRHGEAVSVGMMAAAYLAAEMELIDDSVVLQHRKVLEAVGLPVTATLTLEQLSEAWLRDKKFNRGVRFVLLEKTRDGDISPRSGIEAPQESIVKAIER
ncbi:MAG TPA: 3-dehydroquinate synthase, partial [Actinomycetota bacterium]|nr:3-dehydroquinate synthase [Actinomycetota bacterium]